MSFLWVAAEGICALSANKLRNFLMMLGMIVGVALLAVIMAVGKGTQQKVIKRVDTWPIRVIKVNAGGGKGYTRPQAGVATLKLEDADAIRDRIRGWDLMLCVAEKRGLPMKFGSRQCQADVFAVEPTYCEMQSWPVQEGEEIGTEDIRTMARVCVVGTTLAKTLFGEDNPIGEYIYIGKVRFRVKGILKSRGIGPGGTDSDNRALIPLTTGMRRLFNQGYISYVRVRMKSVAAVPNAVKTIRQLLRKRHHISPPETDDFSIVTAKQIAEVARGISRTLTAVLVALAGLSLLVGGVVMMNILLISVAERTKEIGLRRALGATQHAILVQFLTEALSVTLIGMTLGAALGWSVSVALRRYTPVITETAWEPFALVIPFALLFGVAFGVHPARRAARLHPVEAMR
ncbi:ABC transporter permease [bacterium]|nr:ABC transporter permease [bacterium]